MQKKGNTAELGGSELVFVVETCQNCKEHHWNTRHDEAKYLDFFNRVASAITQRLPTAVVLRNQIPKAYLPYDLYCNLIPNEDENVVVFDQVPRTGSFEVSYKGLLVFSKLQSTFWPNSQLIGDKCMLLVQDEREGKDISKYLAGQSLKQGGGQAQSRGKQAGSTTSGRNFSKSPMRGQNDSSSMSQINRASESPSKGEKFQQTPQKQQQKVSKPFAESVTKPSEPARDFKAEAEAEALRVQKEAAAKQQEIEEQKQAAAAKKKQEDDERARQQRILDQKKETEDTARKIKEQEDAKKAKLAEDAKAVQLSEAASKVKHDPKFLSKEEAKQDTVPSPNLKAGSNEDAQEEPVEIQPEEDLQVGNDLKDYKSLTGFPIFAPGIKSLLSKYLTKEIWNSLKNSSDSHGFTFKQAIFSGCKNTDSGIGVYAGSHNSYKAFAALFDSIVENYHGYKKSDKHVSDMDYSKLNTPPFTPREAKLIKSTRIRVGRNLADYPLGPGLTKEQRKEVETKVIQVLSSFQGELAGKYYSLSSLTETERKQLIDDHFLFKEGDRFLEACGLNRDWPDGRGIFHNNEKSFLVWLNEEDQLRIISMQQGADIGAVFTRLSKACTHIEKVAKFSHDEHLGYITSCPTNLGTALRASVHIHLPRLGILQDQFQAIADKYNVQIRGAHGEHTETNDFIFDISNKRRLGMSEVSLVQDMYNGVKAMIKKELELTPLEDQHVGPQLKTPDDLTGFPIFPQGTKSLLQKYLTRDLYKRLQDDKDKFGFSFKQAIFSGCQNTDSGIGVYAGSHDSYKHFAEFFDKIIEDYHGHKKDANHVSDMDYTKLQTPPLHEDEAKMIKSTRIRVGRNLAGYPLGPGLTNEQRKEIEAKVVQALSSFSGELEGKYYALTSLTEGERKQLIDDHFLFKEGDRFLEAVGLNRDWPNGRGIFHNNEKSFLVWVNEEDQLRIISMQQGADIGAVFTRLSKACTHIEKVAKFSHDDHLGYITSCPTNLGTALRASVHIQLPFLGQRKEEFEAIADKYHVQIRGAHGEHTETDDHIYDISNKRRLGRSEVDLVQDMYNGVKAMIQKEKDLRPRKMLSIAQEEDEFEEMIVGSHLASPADLAGFPKFPPGTKSLLCKYLTQRVWMELQDSRDKHGFTFREAIFSGCKNPDSGIGVYAGSHDSYGVFADLFDGIIQEYHGHKPDDQHVSDMDYTKLQCPPFSEEEAKHIKSTRVRVGRNLAEFPLGPGLTKEQRKEVEEKVVQALTTFEGELAGKYYALTALKEEERKQLIEDHFLFKEGDRFLEACGLNRDWPDGRGIFHNNEKTFLVWVNEEDQLRIISMQQGADLGAVFTRLSKACAHIEKVAKFAHNDHLGYITSCPTNLGTALRGSVHIHLPKLGALKEEFEAIANKYHVQIRGIHGEHSETADHVYDISNKRRLGFSEVSLIQDMYNGVKAMIKREHEL